MALVDLDVPLDATPFPGKVRAFLREAERRIERFQRECRVPGYVPSDFPRVYATLRALAAGGAAPGNLFCEWGSGFGVVACLGAMLEFDACGIEIEPELVDHAQRLADDFDLAVTFWQGSFLTLQDEIELPDAEEYSWLITEGQGAPNELEIGPADFDVVFAYPWPDEEHLVENLFERHAAAGAVLLTYHGGDTLRLRRKKV
jgi:hypothetical protein